MPRSTTRAAESAEFVRRSSATIEWSPIFRAWKADLDEANASGDVYATYTYRTTIDAITSEVEKAYRSFLPRPPLSHETEPEAAHDALYSLMVNAGQTRSQMKRRKAIAASLDLIESRTRDCNVELALRRCQFESARATTPKFPGQAPIAGPEVVRTWLIDQADLALACHERARGNDVALAGRALCRHRFFKALFDERAHEGDPWATSRKITQEWVSAHREYPQPTLFTAHCHLVQIMVDPNLRPSITCAESPISKPDLPSSRAIAGSRRQCLIDQVSAGTPLSAKQVEELTYLASLANSQGHLGQAPLDFHHILAGVGVSHRRWASMGAFGETPGLRLFNWLLLALQSAGYL